MHEIIDRLKEPSTYAGLAAVAVAIGISADQFEIWAAAAAGAAGFISIFLPERKEA